jgi:hypothetical protein
MLLKPYILPMAGAYIHIGQDPGSFMLIYFPISSSSRRRTVSGRVRPQIQMQVYFILVVAVLLLTATNFPCYTKEFNGEKRFGVR